MRLFSPSEITRYFSYDDDLLRRIMYLFLLLMPICILIGRSPLDIAASTIAVCFLIHSIYWRDFNWLKARWVQATFLFWIFIVLNSLHAYDVKLALARSLPYIRFPLFAIAVSYWIIRNEQDLKLFIYAFVATLLFSVIDGLFEYFVGFDFAGNQRIHGRLSGPFEVSTLGIYLTKIGIPFMIAFFAIAQMTKNWKYGTILFFVLMLITILMAGERMAILLMLFSLVISALIFKTLRNYIIVLSFFLLTCLGSLILLDKMFHSRTIETTILQLQVDPKKSRNYLAQIDAAKEIIRDNPMFGVGSNNYRNICKTPIYDPRPNGAGSRCLIHPHQVYLELWVNNGLIGLLLFCIIIYQWCKIGWLFRQKLANDLLLFGGSLGVFLFLWPLSVGMSIFSNFNGMLFWTMVAFMMACYQQRTEEIYTINTKKTF